MLIRAGREAELATLRELEREAGRCFREVGMDAVADSEPPPPEELRRHLAEDGLWVVAGSDDRPVAYMITEPVDGATHVEQISVHPDSARRGIGRTLLDHAAGRAAAQGHESLTLTTFAEVPWNAPYYERCGFRRMAEDELTPGLRKIRAEEDAMGLDRWPRICMRRATRPARP